MKKILLITCLLVIASVAFAGTIVQRTTQNGMEIVVKEHQGNGSVGLYCFVKTGSNNEGIYLGAGISHYLEHLVSGGTTAEHTEAEYAEIGKEMGAVVNAFTSYDMTAYHLQVDKEYAETALQILSEQMQGSLIDETEQIREKQVILKEIVMRSTPARSKLTQKWRATTYPNANDRFPVIGYTEHFEKITREEVIDYYHTYYSPNNMIFVCVGDVDGEEMADLIEESFQDFERQKIVPANQPTQGTHAGDLEIIEEFDVQLPMVFMTSVLPQADFDDATALSTALQIAFGKRTAPLAYKLKEKLKLVNYVGGFASANPSAPHGMVSIYFEAKNSKKVREIVAIIDEELEEYSIDGFSQEDIDNLVNRYKAYYVMDMPTINSMATSIGANMIHYGVPEMDEIEIAAMEALTVEDLRAALAKHITPKNRKVFYGMPKGGKVLLESNEETDIVKIDAVRTVINDKITMIHRRNTEKPIVRGYFHLPIYSNYGGKADTGKISFMVNMMFEGSDDYKPLVLSEWMEDHMVDITHNATEYGLFIDFTCLTTDLEELKEIIVDAINDPRFDQKEIDLAKEANIASLKRSLSDNGSVHTDFRLHVLYGDSIHGMNSQEKSDVIQGITRDELVKLHKKHIKADNMTIVMFGDITDDAAQDFAKDLYSDIPHGSINDPRYNLVIPDVNETYINKYDFEATNVNLNIKAPSKNDPEHVAFQVIELILSGSRGRLHNATRGERDLAYYAYASYAAKADVGWLRLTSQTSKDQRDSLVTVLKNEVEKLMTTLVPEEEIQSAVDEHEKMMKTMLTDKNLPGTMLYNEVDGVGYDYIYKKMAAMKKITPADIQNAAKKYLGKIAIIVSEPKDEIELMVD